MPTPMPIIVATCVVKSGVGTTAAHRPSAAMDAATPTSALTIGRPMATTEPKATSRITAAARSPNTSLAGISTSWNRSPPNATSTPACSRAAAFSAIAAAAVSKGTSPSGVKSTAAKATDRSAAIWAAESTGELTAATRGRVRTSSRYAPMAARASGRSIPAGSWNTTMAESPERSGISSPSRS